MTKTEQDTLFDLVTALEANLKDGRVFLATDKALEIARLLMNETKKITEQNRHSG